MKIVIDTNVVISAMFFGGKPFSLLQRIIGNGFDAVVSDDIAAEYAEVMERIGRKYPNRPQRFPLDSFLSFCERIVPSRKIDACRDPDDNKFLECAVCAGCLYREPRKTSVFRGSLNS